MEEYPDSYFAATRIRSPPRPPLEGTGETEVCVVGAGLAGLSVALELGERGRHVIVLEGRRIGWGASGRNLGMVGPGFSLGVRQIIARVGMDDARELFAVSRRGADTVRRRAAGAAIDCAPMDDGILTVSLADDLHALERAAAFMSDNFGLRSEVWPRERLREIVRTDLYRAGRMVEGRFMLHPLNYCLGLAAAAERLGVAIHEHSPAVALERAGRRHLVRTPAGAVRADHVIIACGTCRSAIVPRLRRAIVPVATYIIATEPLGEARLHTALRRMYGVSDNRVAGHYYRPLPDTRLLWGARMSVRQRPPPGMGQMILRDLAKTFPQLAGVGVESSWFGLQACPPRHMPLVGPLVPGVWCCVGFSSLGINTTAMAGEMIADAIAEGDDRHRLLAPFVRWPILSALGKATEQARLWYQQLRDAWRVRAHPA